MGVGTGIFLIIFFGIIGVLIIVAIVGSKKDKNEKLIKNDKARKLSSEADKQRVIIFVSLNKIIENLAKELADFKPSIGTKSLGQINIEYAKEIKSIQSSKELSGVYLSEDYKNEMKDVIKGLIKQKPSNWTKEPSSQFSINLVKAKVKAIEKNPEYKELISEGIKKTWK